MYETKRNVDRNLFRSSWADWFHNIYIDTRDHVIGNQFYVMELSEGVGFNKIYRIEKLFETV